MKTFIIVAFAVILLLSSTVSAQEQELPDFVIAGIQYDAEFIGTIGFGFDLIGPIRSFTYGYFGDDQSAVVEFAVITRASSAFEYLGISAPAFCSKLFIGPILGPNFDFIGTSDDAYEGQDDGEFINYVSGAIGGVAAYSISEKTGVWFMGKRKFALEKGNEFLNNWLFGGGVYLRL